MLTDDAGEPVLCANPQFCLEFCTPGEVSGVGSYTVKTDEIGLGGFKVSFRE